MIYSDIRLLIHSLTKTNTTSLPSATLNLYTQPAEDRVAALILKNDSKWQFDDLNRTTNFPIDTQNLVSGQQDYPLGTTYLSLDRVEVKDSSGNWHRLAQIDQQMLKGANAQSLTDYRKTNGLPDEYDLVGNSVFLYPAPNYSLTNGLKFYYTRGPLKFDWTLGTFTDATGSTSSTPGFNSLFHKLIPYWAAYDYAIANQQKTANGFFVAIQVLEAELIQFYGQRDRDLRGRFTVSTNGSVGNESGRLRYGGGDSNM